MARAESAGVRVDEGSRGIVVNKPMTVNELGKTLRAMYTSAEKGEKVAMIHLFGVKYAQEIREAGAAAKDIAGAAGIPLSYGTEINKGVGLSRYVRAVDK